MSIMSAIEPSAELSTQPSAFTSAALAIRRMKDTDPPGIMPIESVSFGKYHWSEEAFLNELKNQAGRYYVLTSGVLASAQELVGYCGYWIILDESHITTVAVNPALRGQALGELLLAHMLDRCMGQSVRWVTLEVRASNSAAQNLYYKYGFSIVGQRPKYYQDNQEDALIMTTPNILSEGYRDLFKQQKVRLSQRLGGLPQGFGA